MRDMPIFTTKYGVASLTLKEIPYNKKAYIRVQSSNDVNALLHECCTFCSCAGAEHIYATGHPILETYPQHTSVVEMIVARSAIPISDASLIPVNSESISMWRTIYNEKMMNVPNASYMTIDDANKLLCRGVAYFVKNAESLIGIGSVCGNKIEAICSICPGGGKSIVSALCSRIEAKTVCLEVASANYKAVELYRNLGFIKYSVLSDWYILK